MWIYYCKIIGQKPSEFPVMIDYDEDVHIKRVKYCMSKFGADEVKYWKLEAVTGYIR